jgi:hypothetical protein
MGHKSLEVFRRVVEEVLFLTNSLNFDLGRVLRELLEMLLPL